MPTNIMFHFKKCLNNFLKQLGCFTQTGVNRAFVGNYLQWWINTHLMCY